MSIYTFITLQCHGGTEKKSRSKKTKKYSLLVCDWSLNSLHGQSFTKLTQLHTYISMYKHDFICLSETYLDSSVLKRMLLIDGYNLVRVTIAMISKEVEFAFVLLPVRVINLSYFQEELLLEMTYYNKNVTVLVICRSRSQSNNEFDSFLFNLEKILSDINNPKPALPIITGNLMQDLSPGGLKIVILQRNPSCLHYLHEMFFHN